MRYGTARGKDSTGSCEFDDIAGTARLLGLEITTDSILDPRGDRVIPLWPEGPGVTAAIAAPIFGRIRTMVDLGAGSGVFALVAAHLGCMALAVDCSPRALQFIRRNAERNAIRCRETVRDLAAGEIACLHCRIGVDDNRLLVEACRNFPHDGVDLVMLNAPFHPTLPGLDPAVHARGGDYGQSSYSEFIAAAAQIARPGGWLIGHQMSLVRRDRSLSALAELEASLDAHGKGGRMVWFSCLKEPFIDAERFLRTVYSHRDGEPGFEAYLQRVIGACLGFELISFRVRISDLKDGFLARRVRAPNPWYSEERSWLDRLNIHRQIALSAGTDTG